jgi:7-cyano-7-deazaguanine synthase
MRRAVVLLSGGIDSTTALAIAKREGYDAYCLSIDYGQRNRAELASAARVATALGAARHLVVRLQLEAVAASALTGCGAVPKRDDAGERGAEIPPTYVPARNMTFLSVAVSWAESVGAEVVFLGVNAVDHAGYPDCTPAFVEAFQRVVAVGTKAGVRNGRTIRIRAPLINMTKAQILQTGLKLGTDYGLTLSCYDPDPEGKPCGHCDSCLIRTRAFEELGVPDPAVMSSE